MKKILSLTFILAAAIAAHAQGTFDPSTYNSDLSFDHSAGTVIDTTSGNIRAFGSSYQGQYYIGPANTTDPNALAAVGPVTGFMGATSADPTAGYYQGDGTKSVSTGFAGGTTVTLQLRAWKGGAGSTFSGAAVSGSSALLQVVLGGVGSPPSAPAPITTMANFNLVNAAPEPATIALGLMGAGALFIRRRKV